MLARAISRGTVEGREERRESACCGCWRECKKLARRRREGGDGGGSGMMAGGGTGFRERRRKGGKVYFLLGRAGRGERSVPVQVPVL